jgi:hypothetical protein
MLAKRLIGAIRQTNVILVIGANDDAGVFGFAVMKPDEVAAVKRQHCATLGMRESQDLQIGHLPIRIAGFASGQDIVTHLA